MFGLHKVPSAHSFPFLKQDRYTCRRYMRTVYCQNGEQVSRTVYTYLALSARQSWSTGQLACSSISTGNPSLFSSCTFEPWRFWRGIYSPKYGEIVWPLYVLTTRRLSRKRSLLIYAVWTSCNSFDLTLSHHTSSVILFIVTCVGGSKGPRILLFPVL